jgi:hypothetical protein
MAAPFHILSDSNKNMTMDNVQKHDNRLKMFIYKKFFKLVFRIFLVMKVTTEFYRHTEIRARNII